MLILLVDDDPEDKYVFIEAVCAIDPSINCIELRNGEECVKALKEMLVLPDFLFLDINMPIMNGIECLRELRKRRAYIVLPTPFSA